MNRLKKLSWILCLLIFGCTTNNQIVQDTDGNTYPVKNYNEQLWMTRNLKVTKDNQGHPITFYYPNNEEQQVEQFGLLYDYETACKVCPIGWRLPTNEDWEALFKWNKKNEAALFKEPAYWTGNNSNSSEFSTRPAGYGNNGEFDNFFKSKTILWSKTKVNEHDVWTYILEQGKDSIRKAPQHPTYGFSIRCIKE